MLPDRVSNPGPLTYKSGALPIALHGPGSVWSDGISCSSIRWKVGGVGGGEVRKLASVQGK